MAVEPNTAGRTRIGHDRTFEIVKIGCRLIAEKGFEGFRTREVAAEAGINPATLHYYFPTKEAIIQGVVDYIIGEFSETPLPESPPATALEALRFEFEDLRERFRNTPAHFVVLTEIWVRASRDPALAVIMLRQDEYWHKHLKGIMDSGVADGSFRPDLDTSIAARVVMAQLRGLGYQINTDAAVMDVLIHQIALQTERWVLP